MSKTITTKKNVFQRFFSSIGGVFIGLILFLASFGVLFWNEGGKSLSLTLQKAVEINSQEIDAGKNNQFVYTTGEVTAVETIGDNLFLQPGEYLRVQRIVEMFSWKENRSSQTETNLGGGETTTTTYTYTKEWTSSPQNSSNFQETIDNSNPSNPVTRFNPDKIYSNQTFYPSRAQIGVYFFDPAKAGTGQSQNLNLTPEILTIQNQNRNSTTQNIQENNQNQELDLDQPQPESQELDLNQEEAQEEVQENPVIQQNINLTEDSNPNLNPEEINQNQALTQNQNNQPRLESGFIFQGNGSLTNPEIGDVRISYRVSYPNFTGTVFGRLNGNEILEYRDEDYNRTVLNLYTTDYQGALNSEDSAHSTRQWMFRGLGFMMMWIGLTSFFAPLNVLLDILPFLGKLSRTIIGAIMFVVALVLSTITILISMIFHNIIALIITILAIFTITAAWIFIRKQNKEKNT